MFKFRIVQVEELLLCKNDTSEETTSGMMTVEQMKPKWRCFPSTRVKGWWFPQPYKRTAHIQQNEWKKEKKKDSRCAWLFIYTWPCDGLVTCPGCPPAFRLKRAGIGSSRPPWPSIALNGMDNGWMNPDVVMTQSKCKIQPEKCCGGTFRELRINNVQEPQ